MEADVACSLSRFNQCGRYMNLHGTQKFMMYEMGWSVVFILEMKNGKKKQKYAELDRYIDWQPIAPRE